MQKGLWVGAGLLLLILIVVFLFNNTSEQNITGELARNLEGEEVGVGIMGGNTVGCTDTDGGLNYNVKGTTSWSSVNGTLYSQNDSCSFTGQLLEWYCSSNTSRGEHSYVTCPSGYKCDDGACVVSPTTNQTTCISSTCSSLGKQCGNWNNGTCSGSIFCGNCQSGYNCNANGQCVINNQTNNDTTAPNLGVSPGISTPLGVAYLLVSADDSQGMDFVQVVGPIESTTLVRDKEYCSSNNCLINLSFSYDPSYDRSGNNYKVYAYNKAGLSSGIVVSITFKDELNQTTNQTCVSNVSQVCANKNCGAVFDQTCWQWVSCGTCSSGYNCVNNLCVVETNQTCIPNCEGKTCGSDGCGGVCGTCQTGQFCEAGSCKSFSCTDSDGGKNYNVAGTVLFNGQNYTDFCNSTRILNEYSCAQSGMMDFNSYACPYGCEKTASGGKCKAAPSKPPRVCKTAFCRVTTSRTIYAK